MEEITQKDYSNWKTATFGTMYEIWHDGLPAGAANHLTGEDRSRAIRMLLFGVHTGDGHAAAALAAMGKASALPKLRTALTTAAGENKVSIAEAINTLSGGEDSSPMAKELVSALEAHDLHWGARMNAAIGLRAFKDKESEEALLRAVEEQDDYLVRYHSCESLFVRWGGISWPSAVFDLVRNVREDDAIKDKRERGREAVRLLNQLKK